MTPDIIAVLLEPHEDKRGDLLSGGVCGSRPPTAFNHDPYGWVEGPVPEDFWRLDWKLNGFRAALALAWEGNLLLPGMDRLDWVQHGKGAGVPGRHRSANYVPVHPRMPEDLWPAWMNGWLACHGADHIQRRGLGKLVLLNQDMQEVPYVMKATHSTW